MNVKINIFICLLVSSYALGMSPNINYTDVSTGKPEIKTVGNLTTTTYKGIENKTGTMIEAREIESPQKTLYTAMITANGWEKGLVGQQAKNIFINLKSNRINLILPKGVNRGTRAKWPRRSGSLRTYIIHPSGFLAVSETNNAPKEHEEGDLYEPK